MEKRTQIRILYLTTAAQSMVRFLSSEINMMAREGFDVHCACSPETRFAKALNQLPAKVHLINMRRRSSPFHDFISLIKMFRLISQVNPDILVVSTPKASFLGLISGAMIGTPIRYYVVRGNFTETLSGIGRLVLIVCEWLNCKLAHEIRPVSFSIRSFLIEKILVKPDKARVILRGGGPGVNDKLFDPDGINNAKVADIRRRFNLSEHCNVIGFVGRIAKDKGIKQLSAAWQVVRDKNDDFFLLIVGGIDKSDPPSKDILRKLQIDRTVLFSDAVQFSEIPSFLSLMDFVVFPTYREGFPNVVIEAGAMEKAIIATKVTGCIDSVDDGETGTLVPPRDSDALANAIQNYIDNPELTKKHGKAGREKVKRYYIDQLILKARLADYLSLCNQPHLSFHEKNF